MAALAEIPDDLAGNPLLLTLLMAIWLKTARVRRSLPSTRGALYRRGLDLLLEDWVQTENQRVQYSAEPEAELGGPAIGAATGGVPSAGNAYATPTRLAVITEARSSSLLCDRHEDPWGR